MPLLAPIAANVAPALSPSPVVINPVADVVRIAPISQPAIDNTMYNAGPLPTNVGNVGQVGGRNIVQGDRRTPPSISPGARSGNRIGAQVGQVSVGNRARGVRGGGYGL